MLLLTETASGYGLFQLKDKKLAKADAAEIHTACVLLLVLKQTLCLLSWRHYL